MDTRLDTIAHRHAIGTLVPSCSDVLDDAMARDAALTAKLNNDLASLREACQGISATKRRLKERALIRTNRDAFLAKFIRHRIRYMKEITDELEVVGRRWKVPDSMDLKEKLAWAYTTQEAFRKYPTQQGHDFYVKHGNPPWRISSQ